MKNFNKIQRVGAGLVLLFGYVVLMGFFSPYQKFEYEGTNALYIEDADSLRVHWLTAAINIGFAELKTTDGELIDRKESASGKVHKVSFAHTNKNIVLHYGSVKGRKFTQDIAATFALQPSEFNDVNTIYVVGDVHGRYTELINLLEKSKVVNHELEWIAGKAHLVFLGDLFDRGNEVTKVLWFIHNLEPKARQAGGYVHLVLGNHEIMTMSKDLRYLGAKEGAIAATYMVSYADMYHPTNSYLGKWLTSKPSVIKIDNAIFAHGGIVDLQTKSISAFNEMVNSYLQEPVFLDIIADAPDTLRYTRELWNQRYAFFYSPQSPFWYRGYVQSDTLQVQLNTMLRKYKSKVHIVAHTPLKTITKRYHGKLLTTDLYEAATQLLVLKKKGKKYIPSKINSEGVWQEL